MASNNMSPLRNFLNSIKSSVYNISIDGINSVDKNASNLFFNFPDLYRAISLNDMNYITNMYNMFSGCYNLINISNFNTSKVINMSCMFDDCQKLTTAPNFDTSNVTDMYGIFGGCWNLTTVPNFNTSKVINMNRMFFGCRNLTTVPNFNTSKVINMGAMFQGCNSLIVPNFNTINVINMANMFYRCNNLSQASVNNIVTSCSIASKVTNKNWTNIGFNVAAGSKWNTWIRTAPDYMDAINIGWQNLGTPLTRRRILVGDNLYKGQKIYYNNIYDLQWYLNRCNTIPSMETRNIIETNILNKSIFEENYDYKYLVEHNLTEDNSIDYFIDTYDGSNLIVHDTKTIETNVTVTNIINNPIYRQLYIDDFNIRPLIVGDNLTNNSILYFTFPDNLNISNEDLRGSTIISTTAAGHNPFGIHGNILSYRNTISYRLFGYQITGFVRDSIFNPEKNIFISSIKVGDLKENVIRDTLTFAGIVNYVNVNHPAYEYILVNTKTLGI